MTAAARRRWPSGGREVVDPKVDLDIPPFLLLITPNAPESIP